MTPHHSLLLAHFGPGIPLSDALVELVVPASLHFFLLGAQIDRIGGERSDAPYCSTYATK